MKKLFDYLITIITVTILAFIGFYLVSMVKEIGLLISTLHSKIEIYEDYRLNEIEALTDLMEGMITISNENDLNQLEISKQQQTKINSFSETLKEFDNLVKEKDKKQDELVEDITRNITKMDKNQLEIKNKLRKKKNINLDNVEKVKQANIITHNTEFGVSASGSHIKINGESYILTCAHIIYTEDDIIWAHLDDNSWHPLKLVKIDEKKDLALFRIYEVKNLPYLEISDEFPKEGSEILIVGNPALLEDVITDGVISKVKKYNYLLTNKIYFGSSGGAVLYKGKIVGIIWGIKVYFNLPAIFVNYSYSSNLRSIKEFLEGIE